MSNDIDTLLEDIDKLIYHNHILYEDYQRREYIHMYLKVVFLHLVYIWYKTNGMARNINNMSGRDLLLIIYTSYFLC